MNRRHDIDALRALAFGLVILYHVAMYYVAGWHWHLKSPHAAWMAALLFMTTPLLYLGAQTAAIDALPVAGMVLMARDRNGPAIAAQILICPMLDHRNTTPSSRQFAGEPGVWTREKNLFAWQAVLKGQEDGVSSYVSPALETDLAGLPTTYIDAGTAEVFRDEDVAYASQIWAAGGQAELHVWAGGFHGFDALFPHADISMAARAARSAWLARVLARMA